MRIFKKKDISRGKKDILANVYCSENHEVVIRFRFNEGLEINCSCITLPSESLVADLSIVADTNGRLEFGVEQFDLEVLTEENFNAVINAYISAKCEIEELNMILKDVYDFKDMFIQFMSYK